MMPEEEKTIFTKEFIKRVVEQYPNHRMYWDDDEVDVTSTPRAIFSEKC